MRLAALPRFPLAQLPTPLQETPNLTRLLGGPRVLLKRDDLTGLAFGGNKTRKLEYLVADAQQQGATVLITDGAAQSNHCRQTAAAARVARMTCALVLSSADPQPPLQGNLLLDEIFGAEVHLVPADADRELAMEQVAAELRDRGEVPYIIPTGGSNPVGAAGYVAAVFETVGQLEDAGWQPTRLYVASASGGTQAGLALGAKLAGASFSVRGISVGGSAESIVRHVVEVGNATADYLGAGARLDEAEVIVDDRHAGPGYGIATPECLAAIKLLARTEGVLLDPVYTAKAFAGLLADIKRGDVGPDETVIFLHTGGTPALFAMAEAVLAGMGDLPCGRRRAVREVPQSRRRYPPGTQW